MDVTETENSKDSLSNNKFDAFNQKDIKTTIQSAFENSGVTRSPIKRANEHRFKLSQKRSLTKEKRDKEYIGNLV